MSRIVVGFDSSPAAEVALDWVAARAVRDGSDVEIVTVTNMVASDDAATERDLEGAERRLRALAPSLDVETHRLDGSMPTALVDDAARADLLVIGVHRNRPVRSALSGRMPARLTARAHTPVCLVPDTWSPNDEAVTVGVQDDPSSGAALVFAADEAAASSRTLRIAHAWVMPTPTIEGAVALLASPLEVKEAHRQILKDAVARVGRLHPGLKVEEALVLGSTRDVLRDLAAASSLVVIGTRGQGPLAAGLFGSVGRELIGQADCPICVVPTRPPA